MMPTGGNTDPVVVPEFSARGAIGRAIEIANLAHTRGGLRRSQREAKMVHQKLHRLAGI